jgi:hypothetical protein
VNNGWNFCTFSGCVLIFTSMFAHFNFNNFLFLLKRRNKKINDTKRMASESKVLLFIFIFI